MRPIHLSVIGVPEPMGSKRARSHNGHAWVVDAKPIPLRDWQHAIVNAARDYLIPYKHDPTMEHDMLDEPVAVAAHFYLPRPKSVPRWRVLPETRPDLDKLARSILDPLTSLIWRDDSQVTSLMLTKGYADDRPPGVDITITPLGRQVSPRARARLLSEEG